MKIAMLIDGWHPIYWWWQIHVEYLTKILSEKYDCKIDLFVRSIKWEDWKNYSDSIKVNSNLNIFRVWPTVEFFNLFWRLVCLITTTFYLFYKTIREKYDLIHAHAYISWIPAKIVWTILRIPVVYTIHWSMWLDAGKTWLMAKIENWLLTWIKYDLEISVSGKIMEYKNVNTTIVVIHNWVDIEKYEKVKIDKKYDWLNFLYVWRFDWQKGLEFLVEAVSQIDRGLLDSKIVKFNLVWDWWLFEKISQMIKEKNLEKYFELKWKIFWDELIREYKSNQIFILPSLAEWQPLVINEAFISWLPVIATKVGDNEITIKEGSNWYLIDCWDSKQIKEILEKFINLDITNIEKMWQDWYIYALSELWWEKTAEKTYKEYLKLI